MTNREAHKFGTDKLREAGIAESQIDAFYLWEHVTGWSRADFLLNGEKEMKPEDVQKYFELIERRKNHEPCQYIIGETEFMGLEFKVTKAVLIPRQDTEILCEAVIDKLKSEYAGQSLKVLDLCTGSGALAVSIKHYINNADVTASDISNDALEIARENARSNHSEIIFAESDLFENINGYFDIIVSNPPYVTDAEYAELMPEVKDFEPKLALTAGVDGLDIYIRIAADAGKHLNTNGWLMLEIGCNQGKAVPELLEVNGFTDIEIRKDLAGLQRVVIGRKA